MPYDQVHDTSLFEPQTLGDRPPAPERVALFGVDFTVLSMREVLERVVARPAAECFAYIVTPNAQHVVELNRHPERLAAIYNRQSWLCVCDSQIVRLLARLAGRPMPLCAGSDLTTALFGSRLEAGDHVAVIGCETEVLDRLRARFAEVNFHHYNPPMGFYRNEDEVLACVAFVEDHPSRYVIMSVGTPQGEELAQRIAQRGRATGLALCVGGSLHFVTGIKPRAPAWMRHCGLEWAFRLAREPRRLLARVFVDSLPVVRIALPEILARLRRDAANMIRFGSTQLDDGPQLANLEQRHL